ncbi:hypothetical protein ACA910_005652 [Epithemia clementina (nom. ined.)]
MATLKAATTDFTKGEAGFFSQLANQVLDSAEKISIRLEEGLNAILTGDITGGNHHHAPPPAQQPPTQDAEFGGDDNDNEDEEEFDWSQMDMDAESPLNGLAESVVGDIMKAQSGPQTTWEHLDAFRHAIRWTEPFILGIIVFQIVIFACTLYVSRPNVRLVPRIVLMVLMAGLVRFAETINDYSGRHWQEFSITQNYFDRRGIFISIFLCAPLLIDSFLMLVCFLREASLLLIQVKTAELKQKRKPKKSTTTTKAANTDETAEGGTQKTKRRGKKDQ